MLLRLLPLLFLSLSVWAQPDPSIVQKLRQGGYVLYMRHAATDFSRDDSRMTSYEDCANQRNLARVRPEDWPALRAAGGPAS